MKARSRSPLGVETSGAAIRRSTSSSDRTFGSAGHARGAARSSAGLDGEPLVEHQEAVQTPDRRDGAGHGPRRQAARHQVADEGLEVGPRDERGGRRPGVSA